MCRQNIVILCTVALTTGDTFWRHLTGRLLSVSAIHFEDRFCATKKVG